MKDQAANPNDTRYESLRDELREGQLYKFTDWPNPAIPTVTAGVYTIWYNKRLEYVGMSGRGMKASDVEPPDEPTKAKGLVDRLNSHRLGRRSGDQFCVYVCDRLIVPQLTPEQQRQIGLAEESLDTLTKQYIHKYLGYRFVPTKDGQEALDLEIDIRTNGLTAKGKPYLNPIPPAYRGENKSDNP